MSDQTTPPLSELKQTERDARLEKFKHDYFATPPEQISQLAADGMIVVIDCEARIRELAAASATRAQGWQEKAERYEAVLKTIAFQGYEIPRQLAENALKPLPAPPPAESTK